MMSKLAVLTPVRRLAADQSGLAVTEFGLIAPVFFMLMIGLFDISHMAYAKSVFAGAVERAAREAALETGDSDEADQMVEDMIKPVLPGVSLVTGRVSYYDFADIGRAEQFTDGNGNDICDNSEPYIDENGNSAWDADIGVDGNGGAGDVVMYTVRANYTPIFSVPFMPEAWSNRSLSATAVRKNQPFGDQVAYETTAGTCTEE